MRSTPMSWANCDQCGSNDSGSTYCMVISPPLWAVPLVVAVELPLAEVGVLLVLSSSPQAAAAKVSASAARMPVTSLHLPCVIGRISLLKDVFAALTVVLVSSKVNTIDVVLASFPGYLIGFAYLCKKCVVSTKYV